MFLLTKRGLLVSGGIVLSFLAGTLVTGFAGSDRGESLRNLEKFSRVYQKIVTMHVDEQDSEVLIDAAIEAMIGKLDPFTAYMDEDMLEDLMVKTKGEFGGLGIIISARDGFPTVISPIEDTPAARLGIRGGDKIVEIEGESTKDWKVEKAVDRLRGPQGTAVDIGIQRYGVADVIPYHIVRDIIDVKSVPYYFVLDGNVGYIRCTNFGEKTAEEMRAALDDLESQGINGLILDLRNNPGGLLESAREVSELFLKAGELIVSTRGRGGERLQDIYAQNPHLYADRYPLVVMINEFSASASEIVAGAIQDWDRGLVVGRNSFGKGSVQSIIQITDREALKLTTAKYYTPSGRCIHKDEYSHRDSTSTDDPALGLDTIAESETPAPIDSLPLAYTLRLGRPVRGGGGIMPDIDIEGEKISDAALDLERQAAFFNFAVQLAAERPIEEDFDVDGKLMQRFRRYLDDQSIALADSSFTADADYIRMAIRREALYRQFGSAAAYRSTLYMDRALQETLALLKGSASLDALFAQSMEGTE